MKAMLAVDLHSHAADLLATALPWIERLGAVVDLVHADTVRAELEAHPLPRLGGLLDRTIEETALLMDGLLARVPEPLRGRGIMDSGTVAETIEARSADYVLVLIGTRGAHGLEHLWAGSVAERVVRSSASPVLVLRPGALPEVPELVWAIAPEDDPAPLAPSVASLAGRLRARASLVTVTEVPVVASSADGEWMLPLVLQLVEGTRQIAEQRLGALLVEAFPPSTRGAVHADVDGALAGILARARDCHLLVVGMGPRAGPAKALLGSVAERVMRRALCPVLVLRS